MRTARCRLVRGATATVAEPALASPGGGATKVFKSASKAARKGVAALWQQPRAKKGGYGDIWGGGIFMCSKSDLPQCLQGGIHEACVAKVP